MSRINRTSLFSYFLIFSALLLNNNNATAAPCCSGGSAAPRLLSSDDKHLLQLSESNAFIIGDVDGNGNTLFRSHSENEQLRTSTLSFSSLLTPLSPEKISDRFQFGISLPFIKHIINSERSSNLGDTTLTTAYEVLPEWDYSEYKPKGVLYLNFTFPTGKSIHEINDGRLSNANGIGFYKISSGIFLSKIKKNFDFSLLPEIHFSLKRTFKETGSRVNEGPGGSFSFGVARHFKDFRVGVNIQPTLNLKTKTNFIQSGALSESGVKKNVNTSLDVSYSFNDERAISFSYLDQTLFGPAKNTTLSRTLTLQYSERWLR